MCNAAEVYDGIPEYKIARMLQELFQMLQMRLRKMSMRRTEKLPGSQKLTRGAKGVVRVMNELLMQMGRTLSEQTLSDPMIFGNEFGT